MIYSILKNGGFLNMELLNCWEINKCERQKGGKQVSDLGECITSKQKMGHSCWAVAGTLSGDKIQCTAAKEIGYCTSCEVYEIYNRSKGKLGKLVKTAYPKEEKKYNIIMMKLYGDENFKIKLFDNLVNISSSHLTSLTSSK